MAEEATKSTADLIKRQGELAARLIKLGNEVTKCSSELDRITKELEKRVQSDAAADQEEYEEVAETEAADATHKSSSSKAGKDAKRDLNYYTQTKTVNTELREAAKKERVEKINKPRPAVREFKHW